MEKEVYFVKDLQKILGKDYNYCYRLIKKLQKELCRENPDYKSGIGTLIPKWYFEKTVLGK